MTTKPNAEVMTVYDFSNLKPQNDNTGICFSCDYYDTDGCDSCYSCDGSGW